MSAPHRNPRLVAAALIACGALLLPTASAMASAPQESASAENAVAASGIVSPSGDGEGPQFFNGTVVEVSDDVQGDVYVSGQKVTISAEISGDVIAAAQTISITGTVDGNVRLAAQDVSIGGDVGRSGTVFASVVNLTEEGSLGEDLVAAAEEVSIRGDLGRDLVAAVEGLSVDGAVGGDVTYYSGRDASIAEGAVQGAVERIAPAPGPEMEPSPWALFVGWLLGLLYALAALSLITLLAGLLLPRRLQQVTDQLRQAPWKALLVGFIASIAVPAVLVGLLISIVGAPLALLGGLVWLLMTLATFVYGSYFLGRAVFRDAQRPVVMALVGGLILIVALHVPWLNIVVWLAMVLFGLGAQLLALYERRPWQARAEAGAEPPGKPPVEATGEWPGEPAVR